MVVPAGAILLAESAAPPRRWWRAQNYKLLLSVADASNQKKNLEVTVYGAQRPLLSHPSRDLSLPDCKYKAKCPDTSSAVC